MTLDEDIKQMDKLTPKEREFRIKQYLSAFIEDIIQEFAHAQNAKYEQRYLEFNTKYRKTF